MVEVPLWYHTTICVFLTSLAINGVILNGLVLRHFWLRRNIQKPYNLILVNLAFVELILSIVGVPFDIIPLLHNGWGLGNLACMGFGAVVTTAGFVSILTICVLSVLGYGSVFRLSSKIGKVQSLRTVTRIIGIIWIYALALSLPPLFGWGKYVPELSGLGCAPDWHSEQSSRGYIVWILVFGFIIPTTIIAISSILTYTEAQNLELSFRPNDVPSTTSKVNRINFRLVIAMNLAYLICWSPYAILSFIHTFISKTVIGPMLSTVPTLAVKLSVCANPILYIAYNPHLKMSNESRSSSKENMVGVSNRNKNQENGNQTIDYNMQSFKSILQEMVEEYNKGPDLCESESKPQNQTLELDSVNLLAEEKFTFKSNPNGHIKIL